MSDFRIGRLNGRFVITWHEADGKRRRYRLDALTRKDAESEAIDVIRRETLGKRALTVAALWEAYRADRKGRPIAETMRHTGKAVLPHFGALRPDQIDASHCRAYTKLRKAAGIAQGSTWTELGHLQSVVIWAHKKARLIDFAPHIERPQKPQPKDRFLTRAEIDRLLAAECEPHVRLAILLMLTTAGRVGAVLELSWDRVDFDRGQINLRVDAEGPRKGRAVVPMNATLRAALTAAKEAALSDYVVEWAGGPIASVRNGFKAACDRAGLADVTPHVLRHTAGVHMAEAGVPMQLIAQYLGHSSTSITERVYARFSPNYMREAADVLDFGKLKVVK